MTTPCPKCNGSGTVNGQGYNCDLCEGTGQRKWDGTYPHVGEKKVADFTDRKRPVNLAGNVDPEDGK